MLSEHTNRSWGKSIWRGTMAHIDLIAMWVSHQWGGSPASVRPSDDCSPSWHVTETSRSWAKASNQAFSKFLTEMVRETHTSLFHSKIRKSSLNRWYWTWLEWGVTSSLTGRESSVPYRSSKWPKVGKNLTFQGTEEDKSIYKAWEGLDEDQVGRGK